MPLVLRTETDMFVMADVADYLVNPVNLIGVSGAGLALEFKNRAPSFIEPYKAACKDKSLRFGTVKVIEETENNWGLILAPTKRHYMDVTDRMDIVRTLNALRDLLKTDQYKYASVVMPMLGCGCGKQDYSIVFPLMMEYLSDLDATVFLSMHPERTELRPRHLTIVGPPSLAVTDANRENVEKIIDKAVESFGMQLSDYTGIASGGLPGLDTFIAGSDFNKNVEETFVYRRTGKAGLVVKPNIKRSTIMADIRQSELLCEIGDDIILIKPKGHNNNRLSLMQRWLDANDQAKDALDLPRRRRVIFGDPAYSEKDIKVLIQTDEEF